MLTGSLLTIIILSLGLLVSVAALAGGVVLLMQNKARGAGLALLIVGALCLLATLTTGVMTVIAIANWSM